MSPENENVKPGDDEQEEQFVAVEEGEPGEGQVGEGEDEGEGEGEEDGQQDERLAADQEGEEDKKERRRSENKTRRARQKEARERTERELNFLRTRNETLEQRFSHFEQETDARIAGSEIATVDQGISKGKSDLLLANQVIEQAVAANDGKSLAEALDHRDNIRDNLRDLEQAKNYLAQPARRTAPPARELDPRHVAHAQQFMVDNDWWDPAGRDQDSVTVLQIDRALVQEGFDPVTKDYWDELRARTEEKLPNRFDSRSGDRGEGDGGGTGNGADNQNRNRGPQFRTGGRERPLRKNEVYISKDRKNAMIEAGVWEDPVLRNKYLKSYADYDAAASAEGA